MDELVKSRKGYFNGLIDGFPSGSRSRPESKSKFKLYSKTGFKPNSKPNSKLESMPPFKLPFKSPSDPFPGLLSSFLSGSLFKSLSESSSKPPSLTHTKTHTLRQEQNTQPEPTLNNSASLNSETQSYPLSIGEELMSLWLIFGMAGLGIIFSFFIYIVQKCQERKKKRKNAAKNRNRRNRNRNRARNPQNYVQSAWVNDDAHNGLERWQEIDEDIELGSVDGWEIEGLVFPFRNGIRVDNHIRRGNGNQIQVVHNEQPGNANQGVEGNAIQVVPRRPVAVRRPPVLIRSQIEDPYDGNGDARVNRPQVQEPLPPYEEFVLPHYGNGSEGRDQAREHVPGNQEATRSAPVDNREQELDTHIRTLLVQGRDVEAENQSQDEVVEAAYVGNRSDEGLTAGSSVPTTFAEGAASADAVSTTATLGSGSPEPTDIARSEQVSSSSLAAASPMPIGEKDSEKLGESSFNKDS